MLAPTTPVLIGAGTATQRFDDPLAGSDAMGLMRTALDAAVADAGGSARSLLDRVDEILVPEGIFLPKDPGRLVLDGRSPGARTVLAAIGVLQQTLFTRAATAIRDGAADVVVVAGGEAKWRSLRGQITGVPAPESGDDGTGPDVRLAPADDVLEHLEIHRSLAQPTHQYAVMESALRHAAGRSPADHARRVAELVSALSQVAAANPDAWNRTAMTVDEVLAAPLVTEPYTKPACSQWNVDQAAAFVLCSAATAEAAGVARDRWVFPVAGAESNLMVPMTQRAEVHRSPAAVEVGRALAEAAGRPLGELELLEVYSCFPSAVQMQAEAFGIDLFARPFSVTGGMHFGGGPLNSFTLQALARLVPMLRDEPSATALLSSVSGLVTKVGGGLWSATPPAAGFRDVDVSERAAATTATVAVDGAHTGAATVAGYTVAHVGGAPAEAVVVADTADGTRAVACTRDAELVAGLREGEWCGRSVQVQGAALVGLEG